MLPAIESIRASAYTVPSDEPESDGTLAWDSTTIVVVEAEAAGRRGLGYTYTDQSAVALISHTLADAVIGLDAGDTGAAGTHSCEPCATSGVPAWRLRHCPRSTWRCGTSRPGCSSCR